MTHPEIFCIDNFFSEDDMLRIEKSINERLPGADIVVSHGPFANQLIANFVILTQDSELISWIQQKISCTVPCKFDIETMTRVKLYLPWDIHSDYYVEECKTGHLPYYNFLIPLDTVQSRTIIFDQIATSPNFSDYKKSSSLVKNPPDEEFWQENLSMCWPQDRQYVSINKVMPWQQRGQLQGFPSKYFHSSDNFHLRLNSPKSFIQIRTSAKHDCRT